MLTTDTNIISCTIIFPFSAVSSASKHYFFGKNPNFSQSFSKNAISRLFV